jgi:hypothetical protein
MLVQCPFPLEQRSPAWWRWSLTILALLITPIAAYVCLGLGHDRNAATPSAPASARQLQAARTFQVARLSLGPQEPAPQGRPSAFELPLELPEFFDLSLEIWGDPATLAQCRVAGQPLGPDPQHAPEAPGAPEAWHHVQITRNARGLALTVDGQPRSTQDRPPPGARLAIEPAPSRPTLVRNLHITW